MSTFYTKQHDLEPPITGQLKNSDGSAINLTGKTVVAVMRPFGATTGTIRRSATIVDPNPDFVANPDAVHVQFSFTSGDTDVVGILDHEWEIMHAGSRPQTVPNRVENNNKIVIGDDLDSP